MARIDARRNQAPTGAAASGLSLPPPPAVAVCLSGESRTFLDAHIQRGLQRLWHEGYEAFLSTDEAINGSDPRVSIPLRATYADARGTMRRASGSCPAGTAQHQQMFVMVVRYVACYRLLMLEEEARAFRYDYVLRTRTDALFLRPFPRADTLLAQLGVGRQLLLFDDQLGLARREHAATLLLNPALAYRQCADAAQWTRACGRPVTKRDLREPSKAGVGDAAQLPCSAMNRVTELGGGSLRQCGPLWGGSCLAGCSADLLGRAAQSAGGAQSCEQAALVGDRDRDRMRDPASPEAAVAVAVVAEQLARASSLNDRGGGGGGGGGGQLVRARIALQFSGHLRKGCVVSPAALHAAACRARFAVCDAFVHTWSELEPRTPHWRRGWPGGRANSSGESAQCAGTLRGMLGETTRLEVKELHPRPHPRPHPNPRPHPQ